MNQGQYDTIETMLSDEYTRGYAEGTRHGMEISKDYDEGLNDAWELARKLIYGSGDYEGAYSIKGMNSIFGKRGYLSIMKSFTAKEALTKIKEYEEKQKKAEIIHVGDEIYSELTDTKAVVQHIDAWNRYECFTDRGSQFIIDKHTFNDYWVKTGKNYPQIEEILKQMNENLQQTLLISDIDDKRLCMQCKHCDLDIHEGPPCRECFFDGNKPNFERV